MSIEQLQGAGINEIDAPFDRLELDADFPGTSPDELFSYWVEPAKLLLWWPKQAEVDARPDGSYYLSWPGIERDLRGNYSTFKPGKMLIFTWRWDHEPHTPTRIVTLEFEAHTDGTTLHLTHGYYREHVPADKEEKQSHIEGWLYFLERLQTVTSRELPATK